MSDDKIRAEFEKWATPYELDLRRLNEGYLSNASNNCWIVWQAAYAAGRKAEREAIFIEWENGEIMAAEVERLRAELAVEREAVKSLGNSFEKLRDELWETKVENTHWEESYDRLKAELAAAKAELQNIVSGQIKANGWEDCE